MTMPGGRSCGAAARADSNAKRAALVADRIIEDVMALGWPVGEVIGWRPICWSAPGQPRRVP